MESQRDDFSLSGPHHITCVDWTDVYHRRSVAASLVQGVYILERDRQTNRQGPQALASPWWDFFNFELFQLLVDTEDNSIFGAIYKFKFPENGNGSPNYVIAFRGTIAKGDSVTRDLKLNLQIIQHALHQTPAVQIAMRAVQEIIALEKDDAIWLAGHSLGAAMAMLVGKNMAKSNTFLESYLFNPPFFSAPIERIQSPNVKHGIRFASSLLTAGLAVALRNKQQMGQSSEDPFTGLAAWVPFLFVHPDDHICSEYIGYFEHRCKMEEFGVGAIERLATQHSLGGLVLSAMGRETESLHLIPSAHLNVNLCRYEYFVEAHGIHQWWSKDLQLQSKVYKYQ
ncbi:hypothetical protein QQ045_007716 [Rhodiola kirilowii]